MTLYMPASSSDDRELPPPGTHLATCYLIAELGTHRSDYNGKDQLKIRIGWELLDKFMSNGRPFVVAKTYTFSSYASSALMIHLESWLGRAPDANFDLESLLERVAVIGVKHEESQRGGTYAGLTTVMGPPAGVPEYRAPHNPTVLFTFSPFNSATYDSLPQWMQDMISRSPQYAVATGRAPALAAPAPAAQLAAAPRRRLAEDLDDAIPF